MEYRSATEIMLAEQNRITVERTKRFIASLDDAQAAEYKEQIITDAKTQYGRMKEVNWFQVNWNLLSEDAQRLLNQSLIKGNGIVNMDIKS